MVGVWPPSKQSLVLLRRNELLPNDAFCLTKQLLLASSIVEGLDETPNILSIIGKHEIVSYQILLLTTYDFNKNSIVFVALFVCYYCLFMPVLEFFLSDSFLQFFSVSAIQVRWF